VNKIINGSFGMEEVRNKISNGDRNPYIERLLVGLLGWDESSAE
jgi:hypothetical protein